MAHMLAGGSGNSSINNDILTMLELIQGVEVDVDADIGGSWAQDVFVGQLSPCSGTKRKFSDLGDSKFKSNIKPSRADPYNPFFIPHSILFNTNHDSRDNQATSEITTSSETGTTDSQPNETPLLTLPAELLTKIFEHVKIPYFQVCLALTCKTMGQVASKPGVMAPWRGYRDKDGLFRLLERKGWMPRSLRFCRACFLYVPRDQKYWEEKISWSKEFDRRDLNWLDIFNFLDTRSSPQHCCPWCAVRRYVCLPSETSYKDLMRRASINIKEWETVCPDVCRRIDQP